MIPFNKPHIGNKEIDNIKKVLFRYGKISGDGDYSKECSSFLEKRFNVPKILMTTSCSSALDITALLCKLKEGEEVILPSYTFVSTANSFLSQNAKLVFADVREDTLNIDENKIEGLISKNTKAIVVVHYGGVSCEMDKIMDLAKRNNLIVIEDAAHAINSKYKKEYCGSIADLGCFSFHETKNITCGEGGCLLINNDKYIERAEIIREKGTDRSKFYRGEVDKYTWRDIGSSYLPSEILCAFLYAQLENVDKITEKRISIWNYYYENLEPYQKMGYIRLPVVPKHCEHNGHLFYILLDSEKTREDLIQEFKDQGILSVFHYIPLHLSPMGEKLGYKKGDLRITEDIAPRLLRLPLYFDLTQKQQDKVIGVVEKFFKG